MCHDLYDRVGKAINSRMSSEGISLTFLAREIHPRLKLEEASAYNYLRDVSNGVMYGSHSDLAQKKLYGIKRLAMIMYAVGFDSNDQIIDDLRNYDARFEYPPANGIPLYGIKRNLQRQKERKRRTSSLDAKIAQLTKSQRAQVVRFVDGLLQENSHQ